MKREATLKNSFLGRRAVVIGAGLGGLSAARVLADYFDEVIILDRDELPDDAAPRPGVPQGKHPHRLLGGGLKALENLFPGFGHELMRAGAEPMEPGLDMRMCCNLAVEPKVGVDDRIFSSSQRTDRE